MAESKKIKNLKTTATDLLPRYFKTDANKKFLQATIDQLIQPGTVKKVNGYIGRQNAKSAVGSDIFITASTKDRQDYQLEPALTIKDSIGNNVFFKDYQDYINQLSVFGSNTKNHNRLNRQEFYSWNPHIDWDKFVNFQNYYWLPYGPDTVRIFGQQENIISSYKVDLQSETDNNVYVFSPDGATQNPTLKLFRGQTYRFEINSPGNPFSIKTARSPESFDRYINPGVTGYAVENGVIEITLPYNSPDILYYVSETDIDLGGVFQVESIEENTVLDISTDILGKKEYVLSDGTKLSNGMKVSFVGNVSPAEYSVGQYYVEGVGRSIRLVNEKVLELISTYTNQQSVPFDSGKFDSQPWDDAISFAGKSDYIVVNRASTDRNPWSRYNRWFHKDVIEKSATYNNKVASIDQSARATRPIIEFEPNIKLYNFGTRALGDVDVIDDYTVDVFSMVEGQLGYNVDGIQLAQGQRVLFTADTDRLVRNRIYKVDFLLLDGVRKIHLVEQELPVTNDLVLIRQGNKNKGQMYWYDGDQWNLGQQKTSVNQSPMFDVFDETGHSFGDKTVYDGSTFKGTKLFSYKQGTGANDATLGFPLSYKNITNIGDIVFNFNLATDKFQYKDIVDIKDKQIKVGYLFNYEDTDAGYINGWTTARTFDVQPAVRIYKNSNKFNNFNIDIFDDIDSLGDLRVKVFVNGLFVQPADYTISTSGRYKTIILNNDILDSDVLTIKCYSNQPINENGYYEVPINLQNNPSNNDIGDFTLGEVIDHVGSIVENLENFEGQFPGPNNLRDLGGVSDLGTKFVQHSGPMSLVLYHVTSDTNNIIRAIESSREDYNKFKRNFVSVAENLGIDTDPVELVNLILQEINKDKPKSSPYYFSDMIPYAGGIKTELTVIDYRIKTYPLTNNFNLDTLSNKAVIVYLNDNQLLYEKDYTFSDQGFVVISAELQNDDKVTIWEFENTNGCCVPPTPTKLGIWPKYEPKKIYDTTLVNPRWMIQGHDGSLILAYNDYRDDLILELEKRIFNNIKIKYDSNIFDVQDLIPSFNKSNRYSLSEFNEVLSISFYQWSGLVSKDFTKPLGYSRDNSLTFNYKELPALDGSSPLPGYWRGVYQWMLGTDRPNLCPWEMLGFSIEPSWWQEVYGPAPYTSDNLIMWEDIADGLVKQPNSPTVYVEKYKRPYLKGRIPVDQDGNIISPLDSGLALGPITTSTANDFVFGDQSPVETAWRRSSYYPFSVMVASMLLQPATTLGTLLDRSRIVRNLAGQLIYKDTGVRITASDIVLPSIYSSTSNIKSSGIINYIVDYILSDNLRSYTEYQYNLKNIQAKLSYRIGSFSSKEKFKLLLDSKTPLSQSSVFVPQEDYEIILNSSSPIKKISYSGVVITKGADGFSVKGYSKTQPYFKYYPATNLGLLINIGGISEGFVEWTSQSTYSSGKVIFYNNRYYRSKVLHTTSDTFDSKYYQLLPSLPLIGGRDAYIRTEWDRTEEIVVPYGTRFRTIQEVVDFLLGYGEYLKDQGFIFDDFNAELNAITNWETSAKEFLFWTTQNWSTGEDQWDDWKPNEFVPVGSVVKYAGDYYKSVVTSDPSEVFQEDNFVKLDGLSDIGSAVISLSPAAIKLTFEAPLSVVDDIRNSFNGYEIFKVDGTPIQPNFLNNYREDNAVSYTPTEDGIYGATFYLVQKEQVVILNNSTLFNDTIYNPESGYRQEKIKVSGYVSSEWNGSFNIPGFIFDQAKIDDWESWKDYALGDIVKYKQFYYSASRFIPGEESFDNNKWIKLDQKPTPRLLPNWTYKAEQFTDFYSLDSDNFDGDQQAVAQHLVGYQKRQYLSNIIKDDVSEFKFYQGMIVEKGTQNVLNKLFDVLSADDKESVDFYEEWALRTGQYGASQAFENIEFIIDESDVKNNPQGYELVNQIDTSLVDFIVRQTPNEVYLKPVGYSNSPWPVAEDKPSFLRTPGYVRPSDVKYSFVSLDQVISTDITDYVEGDYVWVGFEGREWNVYRYSRLEQTVVDAAYSTNDKLLTLVLDKNTSVRIGDIIGIDQVSTFPGFYKVVDIDLKKIILSAPSITNFRTPFTEQNKIVISTFYSYRVKNVVNGNGSIDYAIDRADQVLKTAPNNGELLWIDDNGNNKWMTWQYNPIYSLDEIINTAPQEGLSYGRRIVLNPGANITAISNDLGEVIIYDKAGPVAPWLQRQTITVPFISKNTGFDDNATPASLTGDVIAISGDSRWLATGTPLANNVSSRLKYVGGSPLWSSVTSYAVGDIVIYNSKPYQAQFIVGLPANLNKNPETQTNFWKEISYIPVGEDSLSTNSNLTKQGVVSIYEKDANNIFTLVATIVSPHPLNNEKFGSSLAFGSDTLLVGSEGFQNDTGKVYRLTYKTTIEATTNYNPVGSSGQTLVVSSTANIRAGMHVLGNGFTTQYVAQVVNSTTLILNAPPDSDPSTILSFTVTGWRYDTSIVVGEPLQSGSRFGTSTIVSKDNSTLLVSAPGGVYDNNSENLSVEGDELIKIPGKVFVYKLASGQYSLYTVLTNGSPDYGTSITVSNTGQYIAVSSIFDDKETIDQGTVIVYKDNGTGYSQYQELYNLDPETAEFFGSKISFMNDYDTLVVYSEGSDTKTTMTIDLGSTTFDNNLTKIVDVAEDSGRIDVYDRYGSKWIFSESLVNGQDISTGYSTGLAVGSDVILVGAPYALDQGLSSGRVHEYRKPIGKFSWSVLHQETDRIDLSKIKRAFLYDRNTNKLVSYLDVIDSTQGRIPGLADQEIRYKTFYDPAIYSVGNSTVKIDEGMAWGKAQVGTLWWDLRTAKFYDSQDNDLVYRNSTWNTLFPGASVDIYEWVETTLTPSQWNSRADTDEGLITGVSGTTLYGNDVYGLIKKYDSVAKTFKNTYYYWVKNKKTIPNVNFRKIPANDVAELISNPRGYGYKYLALTSPNSFSLVNVKPLLQDSNIVLSVEYWTGNYDNKNIHNEWKIISNNPNSSIPRFIENKWFDSLCGKDEAGRLVPDTTLPPKIKYGIEFRPRQGMFVNRFEALKQFIEQINLVLINNLIVERSDLSSIEQFEKEPSEISGLYDSAIDSEEELRFTNIGTYEKAVLKPIINDGRITGIDIVQRGRGYLIAPYLTISGTGTGAVVRSVLDTRGRITGVEIISQGEGYSDQTTVTVRNYSILVHSDSTAYGNWSIYSYEPLSLTWSRVQTQSYDVRNYWSYVDWYAPGYNQFTAIDFSVSSFVDLNNLKTDIDQIVKIRTTNNGTWLLLRKYAESTSVDWTQSYEVIGSEKGTIQFNSNLYSFSNTQYGFDASLYDSSIFDNSASIELRIILNAIKNNILTDDLKQSYLDLFFNSVRYVLSEQNYVDWIFKTSFVKAKHSVGELKQKVTYNNDNLENFEDFINEVKPYRTKIREFISSYDKVDNSLLSTTDFDLPAVFEDGAITPIDVVVRNGIVQTNSNKLLEYPWKHWYDNLGYNITSIVVSSQGAGYVSEPVVRIISNSGSGARARAFITNGKVTRISLINRGSGYLDAPVIVLEGGLGTTGVQARAVAIIGDGVIRNNHIGIKFDRLTQRYFITSLQETETYSGSVAVSGSRLQFPLKWAPDIVNTFANNVKLGIETVTINDVEVLKSDYKLSTVKSTSRGYTSYSGLLTFDVAPARGSTVKINYTKDWSVLNAADRIQYYYDPVAGELGKELGQLMTGVDYGGVNVTGLSFEVGQGWDSVPYYTDKWDSSDTTFSDYIVTVAANTHSFTLPYVPPNGTEMNVYYSSKNIETYPGDGFTKIYNFNILNIYPPTVRVETTVEFDDTATTNVEGSNTITLVSVNNIQVGDIVTIIPDVEKTIGLDTKVIEVNTINKTVKLDQILFKDIETGTSAVFTRTLVDPIDCTINSNGTVFLNDAVPTGSNIVITAFFDPVRLDDPYYNSKTSAQETLADAQEVLTTKTNEYYTLVNSEVDLQEQLESLTDEIYQLQTELNALNVIIDGLDPSNPLYIESVNRINDLVNTEIPAVQDQIDSVSNDLSNLDQDIADKLAEKNHAQIEVNIAQDTYDSIPVLLNSTAIMQTIISDGIPDDLVNPTYKTFSIPSTFTVLDGDRFIWRKSTSDGSIVPQDTDYDTALSGGNLAYSTATGLAADDILVDGDGFVTPTSSPAPEEVVPGQIVDAVAIKVYDRPSAGSANIKVDSYIADGVTKEFAVSQQPNSPSALIVKFTTGERDEITDELVSVSSIKSLGEDFTFDYSNRLVTLNEAPPEGTLVSIFSFEFNGSKILDINYFIGDGVQTEFVTNAPYVDNITYQVYVDGQPAQPGNPALFETDLSYESPGRVGLYFSVPPANGSLVNFILISGNERTYSIATTEKFPGNGGSLYDLYYVVGDIVPVESSMLVRVNQRILKAPNSSYYTIEPGIVEYFIDPAKYLPYSISTDDIVVLADSQVLNGGVDYTVELSNISIVLNEYVAQNYIGKKLIIAVRRDQEYTYVPPTETEGPKIQFIENFDPSDSIEVISFYKHDILDIQRSRIRISSNLSLTPDTPEYYEYRGLTGGLIQLDRSVLDESYVWVVKNASLLTPSVDYKLNKDRHSIKLALPAKIDDDFTVITFSSNVLTSGVSYMQFKDMLNRVHFKRLNADKRTRLVKPLSYTDTTIEVEDASNFDLPSTANNKPGVVEIRGERIEYFSISGNVLGQLRRGTLGTGVPSLHPVNSYVQDIGASETLPYVESSVIDQVKADGTENVGLSFVPGNFDTSWRYQGRAMTAQEATGLAKSSIEAFVGGYSSVPWQSGVSYKVDDVVEVGTYTYKCVLAHTSSDNFKSDSTKWSFFVGNIRLKKDSYSVHSVAIHPESPEGDVVLDADFTVDNQTASLTLTNNLKLGTRVTVVKRTGTDWDSVTSILDEDNKISRFLKAAPVVWYATIGKYDSTLGDPNTFDRDDGTFDSTSITFDQG
jgi:hypothetical protein